MPGPIEEEEVVVSLRLQPVVARPDGWRGRSSGLIAAGLVLFIVVGLALGAAFDDGRPASTAAAIVPEASALTTPFAPPSSRITPRPRLPLLPRVQVLGEIPTERRLVNANGLQILDLATGELQPPIRAYEDIVLQLANGDMICACVRRTPPRDEGPTSSIDLRFERLDASGSIILERDVTTFADIAEVPDMGVGFTMAAAVGAGERSLFVLTASRRPPVWAIELQQIDLESGELRSSTVLDELAIGADVPDASPSAPPPTPKPDGTPPDGVYVWATALAHSPDGATLVASIGYTDVRGETWTNGYRDLLWPVVDQPPGTPIPFDAAANIDPNGWCLESPRFLDNDLLVQVCTSASGPGQLGGFYVRRVTTAGASLGDLLLRPAETVNDYLPSIAVDRGRRAILSWDPVRHSLSQLSVDDGTLVTRDVARSMLPDDEPTNTRASFGADPGLVLSPEGQRLYALGFARGANVNRGGMATGVWVFDAGTLNLVDHWPPTATFNSLAVSADGRFVYAAGANGFDVEGNEAPWPASVTVYDARSGEVQVIYGAVTSDTWITFGPLS